MKIKRFAHKFIISPFSSRQLFVRKNLNRGFRTLSKPNEHLKNIPERKYIKIGTNVKLNL